MESILDVMKFLLKGFHQTTDLRLYMKFFLKTHLYKEVMWQHFLNFRQNQQLQQSQNQYYQASLFF